jgi:hypothetical protein
MMKATEPTRAEIRDATTRSAALQSTMAEEEPKRLRAQLAETRTQLRETSIRADRTIADLRLDLSRSTAELQAMHKHCADLAARLATGQLPDYHGNALRDQLAAQIAYNQALLRSTSWKITRPLRGVAHLLKRVRRGRELPY